jgi:hypothetical protein
VLTCYALHKRRRCHDRDLTKRIERKQIAVAGDDQISMAVDSQLGKFVVVRITARGDPLGDGDQLGPSEQACQLRRPWYAPVSVAQRFGVGRSFARLLCCPDLTERGRKKAP